MFINDFTPVFLFLYCWDCASIWVRQTSTWRKKRCLVILERCLVLKWKHIFRFSLVCKKRKEKKAGFNKYLIFVDATKAASVTLVSEAYNCERQSLTDGWVTKVCFFFWCCCFWRRFQYMSFSKLSNAGCRHWQTVLYCLCLFIKVRLCTQTWAVIKVRGKC